MGIPSHDGKHKIMEAGEHCQRGLQPQLYGMDMERVRGLECGKEKAEDTETYNNEVNTDSETEIWFKLLHPKLKITKPKINAHKVKAKSSTTPKFLYSSSSLPCLTLSVISSCVLLFRTFSDGGC